MMMNNPLKLMTTDHLELNPAVFLFTDVTQSYSIQA